MSSLQLRAFGEAHLGQTSERKIGSSLGIPAPRWTSFAVALRKLRKLSQDALQVTGFQSYSRTTFGGPAQEVSSRFR
jgi:hypothetical protein